MTRYVATALAIALCLAVYPPLFRALTDEGPRAINGVLDLRGHDWRAEPTVTLSGEWRLSEAGDATTRGEIVDVPGLWNGVAVEGKPLGGRGVARYSLDILTDSRRGRRPGMGSYRPPRPTGPHAQTKRLASRRRSPEPPAPPGINGPLALMVKAGLPQAFTADRGAGPGFLQGGRFSTDLDEVRPGYSTQWQILPGHYWGRDTLRVELDFANAYHRKGGLNNKVVLGAGPDLERRFLRKVLTETAALAILLAFGLFNLGFYVVYREERAFLYFGLFCLAACGRLLVTDTAPIEPLVGRVLTPLVQRLRYATLVLAFGTAALYFREVFPDFISQRAARAGAFAYLGLAVLYVALPTYLGTYANVLLHVLAFCLGVYYIANLIRAARSKHPDGLLACACFGLFALVNVHDFARANQLIVADFAQAYGLLALAIGQGAILIRRFARLSHERARLAVDLRRVNADLLASREGLEVEVRERTRDLSDRNARLASLQRFKERMLAMIAHDLRSPLQVLLARTAGGSPQVRAATRRMSLMLDNLLDISRAEHVGLEVRREVLRVRDVLLASASRAEGLAVERSVRCVVECQSELEVVADRLLLERIVDNLLENAIKFAAHGGEVRLTAKPYANAAVSAAADAMANADFGRDADAEPQVAISVHDDGPGFAQADPREAFAAFASGTDENAGYGIGLSFVALATEAMGGSVDARNRESGGATVTVTLAAAAEFAVHEVQLSPADRAHLAGPIKALASIPLYKISDIRTVLNELPDGVRFERWGAAVLDAAFGGDREAYAALLGGSLGERTPDGEADIM